MTLEALAQQNVIKQKISIWYQVFRNYSFNESIFLGCIVPEQEEVRDYNLWCMPLGEKKRNIFFIYFDVVKTNHGPTCLSYAWWGRRFDRKRFVSTEGGSSKFYWQLEEKVWVTTNLFIILWIESCLLFSFKEPSDYPRNGSKWKLLGCAGPRGGLAKLSLWSPQHPFSAQATNTNSQADNLHLSSGSFWRDFSESCCNQGWWKSGADTSVRKTALNTLVYRAAPNLEADLACWLLVRSPDLRQ